MDTQTTIWVDVNGRTRATYVNSDTGAAAMVTAILAVSRADVQRSWNSTPTINAAPAPTSGDYQNVADYAQLVYATAGGDLVYLTLPAPQSSIFMADGETVDPVAIATLNAAVIGSLTDPAGTVVATYIGGFRRRSGREYQ